MKVNSEAEMLALGRSYGEKIAKQHNFADTPLVIELLGDVGTGKTTFTRGLAQGLGITEPITSPSFTISKSYAFKAKDGTPKTLTHYDFYRLDDPGLMADDLAEKLTPDNLIVIEWGASVANILPPHHNTIQIIYNNDDSREVIFL